MPSSLRQDLVSGDWVVVAPGRTRRPHDLARRTARRVRASKRGCPFEDLKKSGHRPIFTAPRGEKWQVAFVPNKFPAFRHRNVCSVIGNHGPYAVTSGVGHHEVLVTRDHNKNFTHLSDRGRRQVFEALRDRYLMLTVDPCLAYISLFHNWGPAAGASLYHPHYQLAAIPVIPPDVAHSLRGSERYFKKTGKCVHCVMLAFERKERKRVIFENNEAIAFAPYVSRSAFEVRVFPKRHVPHFETTPDTQMDAVVEALHATLSSFERRLKNPDYNFFIHTAPLLRGVKPRGGHAALRGKKRDHRYYHWHIEAIPKLSIRAGFELGTGIEINAVDPDAAARILRGR